MKLKLLYIISIFSFFSSCRSVEIKEYEETKLETLYFKVVPGTELVEETGELIYNILDSVDFSLVLFPNKLINQEKTTGKIFQIQNTTNPADDITSPTASRAVNIEREYGPKEEDASNLLDTIIKENEIPASIARNGSDHETITFDDYGVAKIPVYADELLATAVIQKVLGRCTLGETYKVQTLENEEESANGDGKITPIYDGAGSLLQKEALLKCVRDIEPLKAYEASLFSRLKDTVIYVYLDGPIHPDLDNLYLNTFDFTIYSKNNDDDNYTVLNDTEILSAQIDVSGQRIIVEVTRHISGVLVGNTFMLPTIEYKYSSGNVITDEDKNPTIESPVLDIITNPLPPFVLDSVYALTKTKIVLYFNLDFASTENLQESDFIFQLNETGNIIPSTDYVLTNNPPDNVGEERLEFDGIGIGRLEFDFKNVDIFKPGEQIEPVITTNSTRAPNGDRGAARVAITSSVTFTREHESAIGSKTKEYTDQTFEVERYDF